MNDECGGIGKDVYGMVEAVLRATNDGDDLAPGDLVLLENALNGFAPGNGALSELYGRVKQGIYTPPWFHGIDNLTMDQEGYVRWRGRVVEHYGRPWAYSGAGKQDAVKVAKRCRSVEARGGVPTWDRVILNWGQETDAVAAAGD